MLTYWITTVAFPVLQVAGISCLWALSLLLIKNSDFNTLNICTPLIICIHVEDAGPMYKVLFVHSHVVTKNNKCTDNAYDLRIKMNPVSTVWPIFLLFAFWFKIKILILFDFYFLWYLNRFCRYWTFCKRDDSKHFAKKKLHITKKSRCTNYTVLWQ